MPRNDGLDADPPPLAPCSDGQQPRIRHDSQCLQGDRESAGAGWMTTSPSHFVRISWLRFGSAALLQMAAVQKGRRRRNPFQTARLSI